MEIEECSPLHDTYYSDSVIKQRTSPNVTTSTSHGFDFSFARSLDLFPKAEEASVVETSSLLTTIVTLFLIFVLSVYEFVRYLQPSITDTMVVDSDPGESLTVYMNITFHSLPCARCNFDFMSISGEHVLNVVDGLQRIP
uniref:Putative endoplasmic reticulum-Golgi intermediate compartment protein 3 n=1 Tax=Lygus hesperus TaxID=30085 RepID=A0A146LVF4_LYGHE